MAEKTYLFGGLDVKANQLEREGNTARDCSNVRLNENKKLIKREEFASLSIPRDLTVDYLTWDEELPTNSTIIDIVEFQQEIIVFVKVPPVSSLTSDFAVSLYRYDPDTNTLTVIPSNTGVNNLSQVGWSNWTSRSFDGKLTTFEKNGCLYFQSASNSNTGLTGSGVPLMGKYDGLVWHCAGVNPISNAFPNGVDEGTLAGSNWYVRTVPMHIDNQGNQIFGEWRVEKYTIGATDIEDFRGRHPNTVDYNTSALYSNAIQVLSDSSLTITANITNVAPGCVVMYLDKSGYTLYRFTVASLGVGTVTFSDAHVYQDGEWLPETTFSLNLVNFSYFTNTLLLAYYSREYSIGYVFGDVGISTRLGAGPNVIDFNPVSPVAVPDWGLFTEFFEDFYGSEIKGNPPAGIQIREYGDGCILIDSRFVYFSDLSINGTVENFTAFDNFPVGEEEKGDVVSFFSNETFIAVFRERGSYLVTGNIYTGNYRVQAYRTTGIGGTSPTGVIEVEGQCLFMSNRGPQVVTESGNMTRVGKRIEPIFTEDIFNLLPDLSSCDTALDVYKEVIYMAFSSGNGAADDFIMVYDYENDEWFKYTDLSMRGGFLIRSSNNKVYYSDGADVFEEQAGYTTGVDAYWASNFDTLGKASLKKRFQRIHLFLTDFLTGNFGFKAYKDWNSTTPYTNVTVTPSPTIPMDNKRLDPKLTYGTSFQIESLGTEILSMDGFEYAYEMEQEDLLDDVR